MRAKLETASITVDRELQGNFLDILDNAHEKMTLFMKIFWDEQKRFSS